LWEEALIKTNVLVIGGGVAGLSTAYFLGGSGEKDVIVLEQERKLGGHASGRNAGMLRQALPDPILTELARDSRKYFEKLESNGWKRVSLWKNGSLTLSKESKRSELESIEKSLKNSKISAEWLPRWKVLSKVPALSDADFSLALFCASDAMVDLDPLLNGFISSLKSLKIPVLRGMRLESVVSAKEGYRVRAGGKEFLAKKIVNAAGAWASWVAEKAGASKIPLAAYRRHLFMSPNSLPVQQAGELPACPAGRRTPCLSSRQANLEKWPFVWDLNLDLYFRPMARGILISPCDKTLEKKGDRRERINPGVQDLLLDKMKRFSRTISQWKITGVTSGLRTMTPDGRFVVGEDPKRKGFYWVAGLGGHGVTTCFSVGQMAANIILGRKVEARFEKALSPGRLSLRATKWRSNLTGQIASSPLAPRHDRGIICCLK
jgi:D-arginine dehydrogenase